MTPSKSLIPQVSGAKIRSLSFMLVSSIALVACASTKPAQPIVPETVAPVASANAEAAPTVAPTAPAAASGVASAPLAPAAPAPDAGQSDAMRGGEALSPFASIAEAGERVFFETDRFDLTDEARAILTRQAAWIRANPGKRVLIAGNCDERGTREYNFALGARRAEAAKSYLISRGVAASRIRTVSFGKERPVAVCDDISCWSQNRRAVTLLPGGNS